MGCGTRSAEQQAKGKHQAGRGFSSPSVPSPAMKRPNMACVSGRWWWSKWGSGFRVPLTLSLPQPPSRLLHACCLGPCPTVQSKNLCSINATGLRQHCTLSANAGALIGTPTLALRQQDRHCIQDICTASSLPIKMTLGSWEACLDHKQCQASSEMDFLKVLRSH